MSEIGFCGDNCSLCLRYIATKSEDKDKLREVMALWIRAGWRDEVVGPQEMECYGCASVKWCRYDNIRNCAQDKGIKNCGECKEYPCDEIFQVFRQTELYAKRCKEACSEEDYRTLNEAFFLKHNKLDEINRNKRRHLKDDKT